MAPTIIQVDPRDLASTPSRILRTLHRMQPLANTRPKVNRLTMVEEVGGVDSSIHTLTKGTTLLSSYTLSYANQI